MRAVCQIRRSYPRIGGCGLVIARRLAEPDRPLAPSPSGGSLTILDAAHFIPNVKLILLVASASLVSSSALASDDWPQYRGENALGISQSQGPVRWNVETGKGIRWKKAIPGLSHSSPIIWEDQLFVITAVNKEAEDAELKVGLYGAIQPVEENIIHDWRIYCFDKNTGTLIWERTGHTGIPTVQRHPKSTHANSTPATDGQHVVTFFGSEGLFCYDTDGEFLWKRDLGLLDSGYYRVPEAQWGFASSPVIHEGRVYVQCDIQKGSFVAALDVRNGEEIWRTSRDEVPTWSTPTVASVGGTTQVILNGYKHIGAYDASTGREVWKMDGGGDIPVPTPIVFGEMVFICSAHGRKAPMYAIRLNAKDDISLKGNDLSNESVVWSYPRNGAYMQTPIVVGDYLYSCKDSGVLNCYAVKTGEVQYQERLGTGRTGFSASPVAANDLLYFTSEIGEVHVVESGPEFRVIRKNELGEVCMATPAISEGTIFFRARRHLIAIGAK